MEYRWTTAQTGRPNENGDVEQRHYRLKRAVGQALLLRDSRDFGSLGEYKEFLRVLLMHRLDFLPMYVFASHLLGLPGLSRVAKPG